MHAVDQPCNQPWWAAGKRIASLPDTQLSSMAPRCRPSQTPTKSRFDRWLNQPSFLFGSHWWSKWVHWCHWFECHFWCQFWLGRANISDYRPLTHRYHMRPDCCGQILPTQISFFSTITTTYLRCCPWGSLIPPHGHTHVLKNRLTVRQSRCLTSLF